MSTNLLFKRIMIFGRPGSGKSTFSAVLASFLQYPLHHLDKYFFTQNWVERDYSEFIQIQQEMANANNWIIDGNSTRSLEIRWSKADLVLYFNFSRMTCLFRIFQRFFYPNQSIHDRADNCPEAIRWSLLKYMWEFDKRVSETIKILKKRYPNAIFKEITCQHDLDKLTNELMINHYTHS